MMRFEWNALCVGDRVVLHDPAGTEFALLAGTVTMIETKRSKHGANGVGLRVETDGGHRVVWPSFLATHHDPPDPTEDCWRCASLAEAADAREPFMAVSD